MFPEMRHQRLLIRSVNLEEALVADRIEKALEVFKKNIVGPQKYLNTYKKYQILMNNKAEQDVAAFLKENHSLKGYFTVSPLHFTRCSHMHTLCVRHNSVLLLCSIFLFHCSVYKHAHESVLHLAHSDPLTLTSSLNPFFQIEEFIKVCSNTNDARLQGFLTK